MSWKTHTETAGAPPKRALDIHDTRTRPLRLQPIVVAATPAAASMGINREAVLYSFPLACFLVARSLGLKFLFSFLNLVAKLFQAIITELARFLENLLLLFISVMFHVFL